MPDPVVPEIKLPEVNVIRSKDDADKLALAMHQPDYLRTPRYVFNVMAPIGTARTGLFTFVIHRAHHAVCFAA